VNDPIYDFAIVGAGMAGASLAAELAPYASVLVLEAEDTPGYHSTGRSAAFWDECYGGTDVVPLTLASGPYLREHGFLTQRGAVHLARESDLPALESFFDTFAEAGATLERLGRGEIEALIPNLRDEWQHAVRESACADIDVAGLHQHYLRAGSKAGAKLACRSQLVSARFANGVWHIGTHSGASHRAATLINAAGAWADPVAEIAGVHPIGIEPMRRTVAQLRVSGEVPDTLPLVLDINGGFYFKPDNGRIWLSPHDETPSEPCDAAPEEMDVAIAIERFASVMEWRVEKVERRWAGLRSFAPDRLPVYGRDTNQPAFAWFAGQGGFGIQTAPAAARFMAQQLLGQVTDKMTVNICNHRYSPARFG
jgi:D-arginine dehydrogenase